MNSWKTTGLLLVLPAVAVATHLCGLVYSAGDRWPARSTPESLTRRIAEMETGISLQKNELERFPAARTRLRAMAETAENISSILPSCDRPEDLFILIRAQAKDCGVTVRKIDARVLPLPAGDARKNGKGRAKLLSWRFSVVAEGGFDQLAGFINRLEQSDQPDEDGEGKGTRIFFEVADFSITSTFSASRYASEVQPDVHPCTLTLHTYQPDGDGSR